MKTIDIVGKNYFGKWNKVRTACRAIVLRECHLPYGGREMLLSYETKTDQWMLPGGGLESNENEKKCVVRETEEETGFVIKPSECLLEINEYYEDWKWVNRYFTGEIIGISKQQLTEREKEVGMEARWIRVEDIMVVFSENEKYADTDEMRRGMYLREYTALTEILRIK